MQKGKKVYLIGLCIATILCCTHFYSFAQTKTDTDTITNRFRNYVLTSAAVNDTKVKAYLDSMQVDGSWNDVNYNDQSVTNWLPIVHLNRLLSISMAYNTSKSIYYHSVNVKSKIYLAFSYWNTVQPYSTNWYNNDIGGPTVYGKSLILMKTGDAFGFSKDTLYNLADIGLNYYNVSAAIYVPQANEAVMGSNQTLNLQISIYKACIKDSTDELSRNFDTAFASIRVMAGSAVGMKLDNSYYMHGSQLYNWGYGSTFLEGVSFLGYYARSTAFSLSMANINSLIDFTLDGQQWFSQKGTCDYNAMGRSITRSGGTGISGFRNSCVGYLVNLSNAYRTTELTNYVKYLAGGNVTFQSPGNTQFWKSDFMSHHSSKFYLSVKTPSKRTIGTESLNGENLKGKYLPWGSTNIMINGDEYANAFPVWDWTRVPGTTTENAPSPSFSSMPKAGFTPTNTFAGGISDGVYGLSADAFSFDSVNARKAYFFTPSALYCLGAGITSKKANGPILTSVNQCMSSGTITVDSAGVQQTFTGQQQSYTKLSWVHHNNVGYLFPHQGNIAVANQVQTGSWNSINSAQSSTPVSNTIFSAWFNHGTKPTTGTYEYIVVPYKSVSQFAQWTTSYQLKKIANNANVQVFADDSAGVYGVAFYKADSILLDTANAFSIKTSSPALLLIHKQTNGYSISVAEPTQLLSSITLTISKSLSGINASLNPDSTTNIVIVLPKGDSAGATVTNQYSFIYPLPIHFTNVKATLTNGKIAVNWSASNADGTIRYEVEKSVDGKTFAKIGEQDAQHASTSSYVFMDENMAASNYYRIKAISISGDVSYSNVVVVKLSIDNSQLMFYPNPLKGKALNLSLTNVPAGRYTVTISNIMGQKLSAKTINHTGGDGTYNMAIANSMAAGVYNVTIRKEGNGQLINQISLLINN